MCEYYKHDKEHLQKSWLILDNNQCQQNNAEVYHLWMYIKLCKDGWLIWFYSLTNYDIDL
jgi:hypothetical protein